MQLSETKMQSNLSLQTGIDSPVWELCLQIQPKTAYSDISIPQQENLTFNCGI